MPLFERDANAQQPSRRAKQNTSGYPVYGVENAAPTTARFLAPTKSSSAKTTPPPRATPSRSGRQTPNPSHQTSHLPRRPGPAALTPPTSKWSSTIARGGSKSSPNLLTPTSTQPSVCIFTATTASSVTNPEHPQVQSDSAPLLHTTSQPQKPLPSRPMVYLANDPSPSKDSRSLIDASEKPLRLSVGGSQYEWPSLTPSPASTPTMESSPSPSARLSASTASMLASASQLTRTVTHKPGSADLKISKRAAENTLSADAASQATVTPAQRAFPPRTTSLRASASTGSLASARTEGDNIDTSLSSFSRDARPTSSRPHSPSPASFSRPRPTSISHVGTVAASNVTKTPTPNKAHKTASRIPLPDQKKPTLVDIRSRRSSGIPAPKYERGLSFGGRSIDSPDPLKVLDHGIKRRQLQRTNTSGSTSTTSAIPTRILTTNVSTAVNRNEHASSPDSTLGSTSDDEEEVATPSDKSMHFVKHGYKPKHMKRLSYSNSGKPRTEIYEESEVVLSRPPPSNSPFTGPLQTIESQSTLPVGSGSRASDSSFGDANPKGAISAFAQRLSRIQDAHRARVESSHPPRARLVGEDTRNNLVELLHECDAAGLDGATQLEISRTLSILEGTSGKPPQTNIDMDQLSMVFGRLKSGLEKDAAAAECYLARQETIAIPPYDNLEILLGSTQTDQDTSEDVADNVATAENDGDDTASQHSKSKTVRSKWSTSTVSDRDQSPTSRRHTFIDVVSDLPPQLPPKDNLPGSIGYPSRVPGKAHQVLGPNERSNNERRTSTPNGFASRLPGSVRAAHEKARSAAGSISRTNLHLPSKSRSETTTTANKHAYSVAAEPQRGRSSDQIQRTRSRSKSRYVLDKLKNGIFSAGKREKRDSQLPPVPPIKDALRTHKVPDQKRGPSSELQSPALTAASLIKMPTMSPSSDTTHPALRHAPSVTSSSSITNRGDKESRSSLQSLSTTLLGRAQKEADPAKKERLLSFAKVC